MRCERDERSRRSLSIAARRGGTDCARLRRAVLTGGGQGFEFDAVAGLRAPLVSSPYRLRFRVAVRQRRRGEDQVLAAHAPDDDCGGRLGADRPSVQAGAQRSPVYRKKKSSASRSSTKQDLSGPCAPDGRAIEVEIDRPSVLAPIGP